MTGRHSYLDDDDDPDVIVRPAPVRKPEGRDEGSDDGPYED